MNSDEAHGRRYTIVDRGPNPGPLVHLGDPAQRLPPRAPPLALRRQQLAFRARRKHPATLHRIGLTPHQLAEQLGVSLRDHPAWRDLLSLREAIQRRPAHPTTQPERSPEVCVADATDQIFQPVRKIDTDELIQPPLLDEFVHNIFTRESVREMEAVLCRLEARCCIHATIIADRAEPWARTGPEIAECVDSVDAREQALHTE